MNPPLSPIFVPPPPARHLQYPLPASHSPFHHMYQQPSRAILVSHQFSVIPPHQQGNYAAPPLGFAYPVMEVQVDGGSVGQGDVVNEGSEDESMDGNETGDLTGFDERTTTTGTVMISNSNTIPTTQASESPPTTSFRDAPGSSISETAQGDAQELTVSGIRESVVPEKNAEEGIVKSFGVKIRSRSSPVVLGEVGRQIEESATPTRNDHETPLLPQPTPSTPSIAETPPATDVRESKKRSVSFADTVVTRLFEEAESQEEAQAEENVEPPKKKKKSQPRGKTSREHVRTSIKADSPTPRLKRPKKTSHAPSAPTTYAACKKHPKLKAFSQKDVRVLMTVCSPEVLMGLLDGTLAAPKMQQLRNRLSIRIHGRAQTPKCHQCLRSLNKKVVCLAVTGGGCLDCELRRERLGEEKVGCSLVGGNGSADVGGGLGVDVFEALFEESRKKDAPSSTVQGHRPVNTATGTSGTSRKGSRSTEVRKTGDRFTAVDTETKRAYSIHTTAAPDLGFFSKTTPVGSKRGGAGSAMGMTALAVKKVTTRAAPKVTGKAPATKLGSKATLTAPYPRSNPVRKEAGTPSEKNQVKGPNAAKWLNAPVDANKRGEASNTKAIRSRLMALPGLITDEARIWCSEEGQVTVEEKLGYLAPGFELELYKGDKEALAAILVGYERVLKSVGITVCQELIGEIKVMIELL